MQMYESKAICKRAHSSQQQITVSVQRRCFSLQEDTPGSVHLKFSLAPALAAHAPRKSLDMSEGSHALLVVLLARRELHSQRHGDFQNDEEASHAPEPGCHDGMAMQQLRSLPLGQHVG